MYREDVGTDDVTSLTCKICNVLTGFTEGFTNMVKCGDFQGNGRKLLSTITV